MMDRFVLTDTPSCEGFDKASLNMPSSVNRTASEGWILAFFAELPPDQDLTAGL